MITLNDYTIREEIFFGEKSIVYRGEKQGKSVIIKILRNEYPSVSDLTAFKRESELVKNLNKTGVVKTLSVEKYRNSIAIIFEDIDGEALSTLLKNGVVLSLADILNISIKIAQAVKEIHNANFVHRDIKPHNIVYNTLTENLNIIDFGSATQLLRQNSFIPLNSSIEGTLAYISPEQTGRMNRSVDYRSDFYSIGVTIYQLLINEIPFYSSDPMELVHAHIAKMPITPEVKNGTPKPVSDLVMKLLQKNPEDRYQNVDGLIYDLEWCASNISSITPDLRTQKSNNLGSFRIGEKDFSTKFQIPEKLYGRGNEIFQIMSIFERVATGNKELLLVSGQSGIGKTNLIKEVYKPITEYNGFFITGKFELLKRSIPFKAITIAFQSLVLEILSGEDDSIIRWRNKILNALGPNAQLIIDVVPELESLIGIQKPVLQLGIEESEKRLNFVFQSFLKILSGKEHPLVIFLDDLQWADTPSIKLIQNFLTDPEIKYAFFILSFRDNEILPTDAFSFMLNNLKLAGFEYKEIYLSQLTLFDIHALVMETLSCEKEKCRELVEVLFTKTNGNPFFVNALFKNLYERNFIFFSESNWEWKIDKIREVEISENVLDLMVEKIRKLPQEFIEIIKISTSIGNEFNSELLSKISAKDSVKLDLKLQILTNEGFFIENENNLRFAHDKIREAIYTITTEEEKAKNHYAIGKAYLNFLNELEIEDKVFTIVTHLNQGIVHIKDAEEKELLIKLNHLAGGKALGSFAYFEALHFFKIALDLLPENKWEDRYALTLEFYINIGHLNYLTGQYSTAEKYFYLALSKVTNIFEKIPIIHILLRQKSSEFKGEEAFQIGFDVLRELGFDLPNLSDRAEIQFSFIKQLGEYEESLKQRSISDLFNLPEMTDRNAIEAISIITNLDDIAISMKPEMLGFMSILGVNISLKYGNTTASPISYVMWGVITNLMFEDYKSGYELGQLSIKLNREKFPSDLVFAKVYAFYGWNINHYRHHSKEDIEIGKKGFEIAMANSDLVYAAYFIMMPLKISFNIGNNLTEVVNYGKKCQIFGDKYKQFFAYSLVNSTLMTALALQGNTENATSLNTIGFSEDGFLDEFSNYGLPMAYFYLRKFQLFFFFGEYENCMEVLPKVEKYFPNIPAHITYTEFYFYTALVLLIVFPSFSELEKEANLKKIEEAYRLLKLWTECCEENFLHLYLIVGAQKASLEGRDIEAMQFFDKAIASASKFDFTNYTAIANELAGKFYLKKGLEKIASVYLQEAIYLYKVWGAEAKANQLENKYPSLQKQQPRSLNIIPDESIKSELASNIGTTLTGNFLDIHSVIKASQTISGEIKLEKLLEKMMKIILENAGAEKGFFLLKEDEKWYIKAEGNASNDKIEVLEVKPLDGNSDLCTGIVNYVAHTKRNLILSDAARKGVFVNDDYIKKTQPKSILCYQVISHGSLLGIVYLENNLITDAFTGDRIEILRILSSQIALSLENSILYASLEERVFERTKDLNHTLENLKITQNELIQSEKMAALGQLIAGIAHEINTPIGAIGSSIHSVQEFLDKDFMSVLEFFMQTNTEERKFMQTVLSRQAENNKFLSSKEKRSMKLKLEQKLEKNQVEHANSIADHLTDIGINEDIDEFLPILKSSGIELLNKIYKLSILRKGFNTIQSATDKTSKIIYALKSYSHSESSEVKTKAKIDLGMDTVLTLYQNVFNRGIELVKEYDSNIPEINCYPDELNQVWINLIQNSIYAMGSYGRLLVRIKKESTLLLVEIIDNGRGIPESVQEKIYEPFFTTKPLGEGSGLGLGIVKKILEKHDGKIQFKSQPGRTVFSIALPIW